MRHRYSGVVIVDKPEGLSSAQVVARVKRVFGASKAGHTGTLDPFATGVMVCPLNQATRLSRFLLQGNKTYQGVLRLGVETDTQDATGTVTARQKVPELDRQQIGAVFEQFTGDIQQAPPAFSALKHQGVPLYKLARQGRPVQKPPRPVRIFDLSILEISLPRIGFEVTCSAGTYVRTLCADMGSVLGCGGHLESLRRTQNSGFALDRAVTLEQLAAHGQAGTLDRVLIPMAEALPGMPGFQADAVLAGKIAVGQPVDRRDNLPVAVPGSRLKVVDGSGEMLAVMEAGQDKRWRYCCVFGS